MSDPSATPSENPIILNLMSEYGTQVIGAIFSVALWGISCMQMFLYFFTYEKDHWFLKSFVVYLWAVETVIEALTWYAIWPALISKWGSLAAAQTVPPATIHRTWLSYLLAFSVQMFFLYRIYRFTGGKSWLVFVGLTGAFLIASYQIVGIIIYTKDTIGTHEPMADFLKNDFYISLEVANRAASAFVDIVIAVWMSLLLASKRNSVFRSSNKLVYRLIFMTLNSGMWTAIVALIDFILIASRTSGAAFTLLEYPIGALYANMCLANLNARRPLRDHSSMILQAELGHSNSSSSGVPGIPLRSVRGSAKTVRPEESVVVHIETTSMTTKTEPDRDSVEMHKASPTGL